MLSYIAGFMGFPETPISLKKGILESKVLGT